MSRSQHEVQVEELMQFLGEGFHSALRKVADSDEADHAWHAIDEMDDDEWRSVLSFVAWPLVRNYKIERRVAKDHGTEESEGPGAAG